MPITTITKNSTDTPYSDTESSSGSSPITSPQPAPENSTPPELQLEESATEKNYPNNTEAVMHLRREYSMPRVSSISGLGDIAITLTMN